MITAEGLTKQYGAITAVSDVSFQAADGEILGFLGPNGAGKTTTMNMLTGYIAAGSGSVTIQGIDLMKEPEKAKRHIGYLPDTPPLYGEMRVDEYLQFTADLKGVKKSERKEMIEKIKDMVKISDQSRRLIRNLSKGYRQRVGLAQALIGFPSVIILDEPTVGLDPKQIIEMREVIHQLGKQNTVILSSHILSEVSAVCDRVMIMNRGKIVASDTPDRLGSSLKQGRSMSIRVKASLGQIQAAFKDSPLIHVKQLERGREPDTCDAVLESSGEEDIREQIFYTLAGAELPLLMMKSNDLSLEEIFLQITETDAPESILDPEKPDSVSAEENIPASETQEGESSE